MTTTQAKTTDTDRIEKRIVLGAARSRVWRAITNAEEFGTWFRMAFDGPFAVGATVRGRLTHPSHQHVTIEMFVERIEPERLFSYRWHPYALDTGVDYSTEPTTLVEFRLEDAGGGTSLVIVESGFDRLPPARRAEAFRMNDGGWTAQLKNIERHVQNG